MKAIKSILLQTYSELEIWLIDDGSTDNTREILDGFSDDRIRRLYLDKNTGKVGAVNEVLKMVTGDLICFQDADDWSEADRIEVQVQQFIEQPDLGICFTNYKRINDSFIPSNIALTNAQLQDEFFNYLRKNNVTLQPTHCATMMVSRVALEATGGYHPYFGGRACEDSHWVYRILKKYKGVSVDKVLYNYLYREGSFTEIQFNGNNAKYAYSWQLLSLIIAKDYYEQIDVLKKENSVLLKELELKACENALVSKIKELTETKKAYETSHSFRLGKLFLKPFQFFFKK